jgi:hypothetical protein
LAEVVGPSPVPCLNGPENPALSINPNAANSFLAAKPKRILQAVTYLTERPVGSA